MLIRPCEGGGGGGGSGVGILWRKYMRVLLEMAKTPRMEMTVTIWNGDGLVVVNAEEK